MTDDLAAFVAVRLDELELAAKIASVEDAWGQLRQSIPREPGPLNRCHRLMEEGSPARALREVAAKRVILELHDRVHDCPVVIPVPDPSVFDGTLGYVSTEYIEEGEPDVYPCTTLRQLAAVWSDHPDYRQEWAP